MRAPLESVKRFLFRLSGISPIKYQAQKSGVQLDLGFGLQPCLRLVASECGGGLCRGHVAMCPEVHAFMPLR